MSDVLLLNSDYQPMNVVPLSTVPWQDAISGICKGIFEVVHYYDDWVVRSPSTEIRVPSVIVTKNYVHIRNKYVKKSRQNIYLRDKFTCQYCGGTYAHRHLNLDHVVPRSKGGSSDWDNLATSCIPCNNLKADGTKMRPKELLSLIHI